MSSIQYGYNIVISRVQVYFTTLRTSPIYVIYHLYLGAPASIPQTSSSFDAHASTSTSEWLLGYVQNVSPTRLTKKESEYFTFTIQENKWAVKAICFSLRKHKPTVETNAESIKPCKITKFTPHAKEENVVWINQNTNIEMLLKQRLTSPTKNVLPTQN